MVYNVGTACVAEEVYVLRVEFHRGYVVCHWPLSYVLVVEADMSKVVVGPEICELLEEFRIDEVEEDNAATLEVNEMWGLTMLVVLPYPDKVVAAEGFADTREDVCRVECGGRAIVEFENVGRVVDAAWLEAGLLIVDKFWAGVEEVG